MLDRVPADRKVSIERATFPAMVAEGVLFAVQSPAAWVDAGTPASLLQPASYVLIGVIVQLALSWRGQRKAR